MRRPSPPSWRAWRRSTPVPSSGPRCAGRVSGPGPATWCFKRQAVGASIGLIALLAAMKFGYRRMEALALPFLFVSLALLVLMHLPGLGHSAGGARRWMRLGAVTFQPSELAKIALVLWLARSLARKQERVRTFSVGFLPHMVMLALFGFL